MNQPSDHSHYVRRVVLPSGRAIEVVYFENAAPATPPAQPGPAPAVQDQDQDLHICPDCTQELVYPLDWEEYDDTRWEVVLRCPNCDRLTVGIYRQETVDRFDEQLDRGTDALSRDLRRLTRANMEDEIERFVSALAVDAILPEDFGALDPARSPRR